MNLNNFHAKNMNGLRRRGFNLGLIPTEKSLSEPDTKTSSTVINASGYPVLIKDVCTQLIAANPNWFKRTEQLVLSILDGQHGESLLSEHTYSDSLQPSFELQGSSISEGDEQEIETVFFDGLNNSLLVAEDLWMKISWLSFHEEDASLRFRFSFGMNQFEDVAADELRQQYAAALCDAVFPESSIVTQNAALLTALDKAFQCKGVRFVERIIYFNAPDGGAYFHHDLERGHAGVMYAQLSGATFWLALPKHALMEEIKLFVKAACWPDSVTLNAQQEIIALAQQEQELAQALDSFANGHLIQLINETDAFVQQLIENGHGQRLDAGDVLLLPQESADTCCWHSVFCLGEETGQALSFAIRRDA